MIILPNKIKGLLIILFVLSLIGCSKTNTSYNDAVQVLSVKFADDISYISYLDKSLEQKNIEEYKTGRIGFLADKELGRFNEKLYAVASDGKLYRLKEINTKTGKVNTKFDHNVDAQVVIKDYLYFSNQGDKENIVKYNLVNNKIETSIQEQLYIFSMISYNNRLFAFKENISSVEVQSKVYFTELNTDTLDEISRIELEAMNATYRPVIVNDKLYYCSDDEKSIIVQNLNGKDKKQIKIVSPSAKTFRVISDKLYILNGFYAKEYDDMKYANQLEIIDLKNNETQLVKLDQPVMDIKEIDNSIYILYPNSIAQYDKQWKLEKDVTNLQDKQHFFNLTFINE